MILDKKWKYIAKDSDDNTWIFSDKPVFKPDHKRWAADSGETFNIGDNHLTDFTPEDSLHEIIHHKDSSISFKKVKPPKPKFNIGDIVKCEQFYKGEIVNIFWIESTEKYEYEVKVISLKYYYDSSLERF